MRRIPAPSPPDDGPADLATEIRALRLSVDRFNDHDWVRIENSLPRLLFRQILRGLALGFGTVVGASVLVSVAVYFLTRIDFIPIIGSWANEIADVIGAEAEARRGPGGPAAQANEDGSIDATGAAPSGDAPAPRQ